MLSKVWEIIQTYSDLMGFELPSLDGLHSSVPMKTHTHLGFDIVNNKIQNVKYYLQATLIFLKNICNSLFLDKNIRLHWQTILPLCDGIADQILSLLPIQTIERSCICCYIKCNCKNRKSVV